MKLFIIISLIVIVLCLTAENTAAARHRRSIKHVIHVNGTRGKSSVTRLIAAGLSAGGMRCFCKTTGTLPMTIDCSGNERLIKRRGKANIKEQLSTLAQAADNSAEVLVIECMAVDPELQHVCEHRILKSDIGVVTNARIDHMAEQGDTIEQVCLALSNTVPERGKIFTADSDFYEYIRSQNDLSETDAILTEPLDADMNGVDFPENIGLALAVCEDLGIDRYTALKGMESVIKDPYAASSFMLPGGAVFINAMSANDPVSTGMVWDRFIAGKSISHSTAVLNCRSDRTYRTRLMTDFIAERRPDEVWLMGSGCMAAKKLLEKNGISAEVYKSAAELPLNYHKEGSAVIAIGNIADEGLKLMDIVKSMENRYVC